MRLAPDGRVQRALGVVLGVDSRQLPPSLDRQALKAAFRRQAHRVHPDKALAMGLPEEALAQRFRELKHAYDYLLALLAAQRAAAVQQSAPGRPRPAASASRPGTRVAEAASAPAGTGFPPSAAVPRRRLRFAQYLYYARVIGWDTLFRAMRWQHRTRPFIGQIARDIGVLSSSDVSHVLRHRRPDERFGEAALRLGRLDHLRLLTILGHQHRLDRPIGRYFVEQNILTPEELDCWLRRHWTHNLSVAAAEMRARRGRSYQPGGRARPIAVR
jgi:hypothetical protein